LAHGQALARREHVQVVVAIQWERHVDESDECSDEHSDVGGGASGFL
jgi:hypothetical protein